MRKWIKRIGLVIVMIAGFVALPLAFPQPLFAYGLSEGNLSVHSDQPMPQTEAQAFLRDVKKRLSRVPELNTNHPMQIYVTNSKWRQNWLWLAIPAKAGGFTAAPVSGWHAFFAGADFTANQLVARSGYRTNPPRTLGYYGAHELTHVTMSKKLGWVRFHLMPEWIREGIPDYVAMPDESASELYGKIGKRKADLAMMKTYGVYAPYRLLVAYFLNDARWPVQQLMATNMSFEEARKVVFAALED